MLAMPETRASKALRDRVSALMHARGIPTACKLLGVSDRTAFRLAAGLAVRAGSIALVERELDRIESGRKDLGKTSAA